MELSCVNNRLKALKGHFTATSICAGPTEQEDPSRKCQIGCEQHKLWSKASDCNLRLLDKTLDRERLLCESGGQGSEHDFGYSYRHQKLVCWHRDGMSTTSQVCWQRFMKKSSTVDLLKNLCQ